MTIQPTLAHTHSWTFVVKYSITAAKKLLLHSYLMSFLKNILSS
jgi:hypothetical protein